MDNQPFEPTQEPMPTEPVNNTPVEPAQNEAPVEAPVNEAPAEPVAEAPAEPVAEVPVEVPAEAPAEPVVEAPVEEPAPAEPIAPAEPVVEPAASVTEPVAEPVAPAIEQTAPVTPNFVNPAPAAPVAPAAPAKNNSTTLILGIILGIVVLIGVGIGVYMLLNNKDNKPATPTTTPTPAPVSSIKTVSCKTGGTSWSIVQEYVIDEDEMKNTELGVELKADTSKAADQSMIITNETMPEDPETTGITTVAFMALAFTQLGPTAGVTVTDNSTGTLVDVTYRAVRDDIKDNDVLMQLTENDGKTAEDIKDMFEQDHEGGFYYTCTIE